MSGSRSLILRIPRDHNKNVTRKTVLIALYEKFHKEIYQVDYISQQFNNYTWRVTFKKGYDVEKLVGEIIVVSGAEVELEDFSDVAKFRFSSYKVMWLPHEFELNEVELFFKNSGDVILANATEESITEKFEEIPIDLQIKTGNILVKIKHKRESTDLIVSGIHLLGKHKVFIHKLGEKPKCLRCNQIGHIRKDCPKNSLSCTKCKKIGHIAEKCTMAQAIANNIDDFPDEDDSLAGLSKEFEEVTGNNNNFKALNENATLANETRINKEKDEKEELETKKRKKNEEEINSIESPSKETKNKTNEKKIPKMQSDGHQELEMEHETGMNENDKATIPIEDISLTDSMC